MPGGYIADAGNQRRFPLSETFVTAASLNKT